MGVSSALATGLGAGLQGMQAISSGVKGNRAARQADQAMNQLDQLLGGIADMGLGQMGQMWNQAQAFNNPTLANEIFQGVVQGGPLISQNNQAAASQIGQGGFLNQAANYLGNDAAAGVNLQQVGEFQGIGNFVAPELQQFNFDPLNTVAQQAIQGAREEAGRARDAAREQAALSMQQGGRGLDVTLADRGFSRNSGAAAEALAGLQFQNNQALSNLNRDLANMQSQVGLQAAQFDAQNALQMNQMGSQYNLGFNQLGQQRALNEFNTNLGQALAGQQFNLDRANAMNQAALQRAGLSNQFGLGAAQGLMGLNNLQNQNVLLQNQLQNAAITDPLALQQALYQQNYLSPMLGMLGMMNPAGALGLALGGMQNNLGARLDAARQAGAGKGAALGGLGGNLLLGSQGWRP
jgi:hypothetical protein